MRLSDLNIATVREAETIVSDAQALSHRVHEWVTELIFESKSLTEKQIRNRLWELSHFVDELAQLHGKISGIDEFDALTRQILGKINEALEFLSLS
jgi:hypothetical protein